MIKFPIPLPKKYPNEIILFRRPNKDLKFYHNLTNYIFKMDLFKINILEFNRYSETNTVTVVFKIKLLKKEYSKYKKLSELNLETMKGNLKALFENLEKNGHSVYCNNDIDLFSEDCYLIIPDRLCDVFNIRIVMCEYLHY